MKWYAAVGCLLVANASFALADSTSQRRLRNAFVRKMEEASHKEESKQSFFDSLISVAEPLERQLDQNAAAYDDDQMINYGINMTNFALKYLGCQNIHTFSDDLADDADATTVLAMNRFVTFRLCPRDTCSSYNEYGCRAGFGDYIISMEQYLEAMSQYYFAQYSEYCETCYQCSKAAEASASAYTDDNAANANNGNRKMQYYYNYNYNNDDGNDDNANNDDANNAAAADDAYADYGGDDNQQDEADAFDCSYSDACDNWQTACKDYSPNAQDFEDFFQCAEFNMGNQVGYMGPHCRSDGHTIGIGIYGDENCNEFVSDISSIAQYTGLSLDDGDMKAYYSDSCISCRAQDGYDLQEDADKVVSDICGALYDESAKCNVYMGNDADGSYQSSQQEAQEDEVCTFIQQLMTNSYDEFGEIVLDSESWMSYFPSSATVREMTSFQKWALSGSILLAVGLFGYSFYLHRSIAKRKFVWNPRMSSGSSADRGMDQLASNRMSRMQSGILQNRSRSGHNPDSLGGRLT